MRPGSGGLRRAGLEMAFGLLFWGAVLHTAWGYFSVP
jgi:hypothetical protein